MKLLPLQCLWCRNLQAANCKVKDLAHSSIETPVSSILIPSQSELSNSLQSLLFRYENDKRRCETNNSNSIYKERFNIKIEKASKN